MRSAPRPPGTVVRSPRAAFTAAAIVVGALAALPLSPSAARAQQSGGPRVVGRRGSDAFVARHREAFYVAGAASGVAANVVWQYHPGSRVGSDLWFGRDKAMHGGTAASLTFAGVRAGVRPWVAAGTVCAAGGAFELTQMRASAKDATVNCLGAATAWGWSALARHWRFGR